MPTKLREDDSDLPSLEPQQYRGKNPFKGEERTTKIREVTAALPAILEALQGLPKARRDDQGKFLTDQALAELERFNKLWTPFRMIAMRCGLSDWLKEHVYRTEAWKNRNELRNASTRYRQWKADNNKERYRQMPEDERERRRQQQAKQKMERRKEEGYFSVERLKKLAQRCYRADPTDREVQYGPVLRLLKKHSRNPVAARDFVAMVLACHRWDPRRPESTRELAARLMQTKLDEEDRFYWVAYAKELYEAGSAATEVEAIDKGEGDPT